MNDKILQWYQKQIFDIGHMTKSITFIYSYIIIVLSFILKFIYKIK